MDQKHLFRTGLRMALVVGLLAVGSARAEAQQWVTTSRSYPLGYVYPGWNGPVQPWVVRPATPTTGWVSQPATVAYPYHHSQGYVVYGPTIGAGSSSGPPANGYWPSRRGMRLFKPWLQR